MNNQLLLSRSFGLPFLDLEAFEIPFILRETVSMPLMQQHCVLPLSKKNNTLYLAASDPTNRSGFDEIKFHTGLNLAIILVDIIPLKKILEEILSAQEHVADLSDLALLQISDHPVENSNSSIEEIEDAPIVRLVQKILLDAIRKRVSDIHFEPYEHSYRIRFRIDGILYEMPTPPLTLSNRITARIKILAQLDISERRVPQDGRFKITFTDHTADFRVSTCPTLYGEKVVIRILETNTALIDLFALGLEQNQLDLFKSIITKPQGLILVTGPTGSGKTVSLYTVLKELNTQQVNILTIEDPVEIPLPGVNQVAINPKAGLNFANAMRAFLRQDPDIIMVGEIRDLETAEISMKAAQTGHLVLSTLHTNSAAETLTRLINMGIAAYNLASCASLIIAQRLARRLCEYCKREIYLPKIVLEQEFFSEQDVTLFGPVGCEQCTEGYKGRIGIFEMLLVTENLSRVIMHGGNALDLQIEAKKSGMQTLRENGLAKVKSGITSLAELNRVIKY